MKILREGQHRLRLWVVTLSSPVHVYAGFRREQTNFPEICRDFEKNVSDYRTTREILMSEIESAPSTFVGICRFAEKRLCHPWTSALIGTHLLWGSTLYFLWQTSICFSNVLLNSFWPRSNSHGGLDANVFAVGPTCA